MDNFKIIYKILSALEKSMDLEECNLDSISSETLRISNERWNKYIEMLLDAGYIKGVTIQKYITGETNVNAEDIRITLKGLEYLSENSKRNNGFDSVVATSRNDRWYFCTHF